MEYNFAVLANDALVKIDKELVKIRNNFISDINNFTRLLNDKEIADKMGEINEEIRTIFSDQIRTTNLQCVDSLNKIQAVLKKYF